MTSSASPSPVRTALVAGATGVVGRALVEQLERDETWGVVALSRRPLGFTSRARHLSMDLMNASADAALAQVPDITHIFYTALAPRSDAHAEADVNLAMLRNLVESAERRCPRLTHVQIMQGSKWYGSHLGPYPTPAREDQALDWTGHFYHAQQSWLAERRRGRRWTWSALRPHGIWGFAAGGAFSFMTTVAVYAMLMREQGEPLHFPGTRGAFDALYQCTEAALLARGMLWAATAPEAADRAFNLTNGEFIRWRHSWRHVADCFGMREGDVRPVDLRRAMADKEPLWRETCRRRGLVHRPLATLVNWDAAQAFMFGVEYDQISSMTRARLAGWHEVADTHAMFRRQFERLAREGIVDLPTEIHQEG